MNNLVNEKKNFFTSLNAFFSNLFTFSVNQSHKVKNLFIVTIFRAVAVLADENIKEESETNQNTSAVEMPDGDFRKTSLTHNDSFPFEERLILANDPQGGVFFNGEDTYFWSFLTNGNIGFENPDPRLHEEYHIMAGKPKICYSGVCLNPQAEDLKTPFITYDGIEFYLNFITSNLSYYDDYTSLLAAFAVALGLVSVIIFVSKVYPVNAEFSGSSEQNSSYECGFTPFGEVNKPQLFLFYKLAIFFIIFEAELIFLYP